MKVLGVSGSPIKNSNTDRALQLALEATRLETEIGVFEEQPEVVSAALKLDKEVAARLKA